jgi:hypothetical protein
VCFYQIQGGILQHDIDVGVYESRSDYEQKKYNKKVFDAVVVIYSDLRERHPLCAFSYDEFDRSSKKLTFDAVEYLADIENITRLALKSSALLNSWQRLVEGEELPAATLTQLISKCSPWYQKNGILPHDYFRHIKQGRKDRRPVPAETLKAAA